MAIKSQLKKIINILLKHFDISIERRSYLDRQKANANVIKSYGLLKYLDIDESILYIKNLRNSKAQLKQDLFVLSHLRFKKNGFFVEFGATNGINLSNTYMLEKEFNWEGILAEPGRVWHRELEKNRNCKIEKSCIWKESGKNILFNEVMEGELSTIDFFTDKDFHRNSRKLGNKYYVKTLSLEDLLEKYNAPKLIDYLSIDTEGSEYTILNNFKFNKYRFKIITVEHNYTEKRNAIYNLLTKKGYTRKYEDVSGFDDWYVLD